MGLRTVWSSHDVHHVTIPTYQKAKKVALWKDITAVDEDNAPASVYSDYEKYLRRLEWAMIGKETTMQVNPAQGQLPFNQPPHADELYLSELRGMNVMQFYGKYKWGSAGAGSKGLRCLRRRTRPCVVVVKPRMPRLFGKEGDPRRADYSRVQLLKYKAFSHAYLGDKSVPTARDEINDFLKEHGGDWVKAYAAYASGSDCPRSVVDDVRNDIVWKEDGPTVDANDVRLDEAFRVFARVGTADSTSNGGEDKVWRKYCFEAL